MPSDKYWKMLDNQHPEKVTKLVSLINWSLNCTYPTPFALYQDIIGYSEENYGSRICLDKFPNMGYIEIGLLGEALDEYSNNPQDATDWIDKLMEEECK